jgi:hypothetical protein
MRPERVVLKNHLNATPADGNVVYQSAADEDAAAVGLFEPGDESQGSRFAATAFTYDNEKFTRLDIQARLVDRDDATKSFCQLAQ